MKINKYNKAKDNSSANSRIGSTTILNGGGAANAEQSDETKRLSETHLIFG